MIRNMKYIFVWLCLGAWGLPAHAQSSLSKEHTDTLRIKLEQAIEIALAENPTVRVAGQEIEKKQYARKEMIAQLFPQLSGSAGYTRTLKKQVMYMGGGAMTMAEDLLPCYWNRSWGLLNLSTISWGWRCRNFPKAVEIDETKELK